MGNRLLLNAVADMVRRAILTLRALPDPEARFMGEGHAWTVVRSVMDAYGYSETPTRYVPSAAEISEMERVMSAMVKLRQEDAGGYHRLWRFATGTPIWQLADREGVSARTVRNRLDGALARVLVHLGGAQITVEALDEQPDMPIRSFFTPSMAGPAGAITPRAKVFVADLGFVVGGKKVRGARRAHRP